ncbi:hypothetical protein ACFXOD_33305 [Streptomyces sp. NPDC059161]|uniref:hypothetical protein n=1 Tax=Streptomyces sp. NPDC059161 TaxID=3346749 RepID=UPI00367CBD3A
MHPASRPDQGEELLPGRRPLTNCLGYSGPGGRAPLTRTAFAGHSWWSARPMHSVNTDLPSAPAVFQDTLYCVHRMDSWRRL